MTDRDTMGAWDLVDKDGAPKDWTMEIADVRGGLVKSREKPKGERKPFVYFKGARKPLVCNATNAKTISQIAGSEDTARWIGVRVTLYQTVVQSAGGNEVPGIRIRPRRSTAAAEDMGEGQPVDLMMREAQTTGAQENE